VNKLVQSGELGILSADGSFFLIYSRSARVSYEQAVNKQNALLTADSDGIEDSLPTIRSRVTVTI